MYNISTRINIVLYNCLLCLVITSAFNFMDGLYNTNHDIKDASFEMKKIDHFINDKIINEYIVSF